MIIRPFSVKSALTLSEYVSVGASATQCNRLTIVVPHQQPVKFNVAFPIPCHVSRKPMHLKSWLRLLSREERVNHMLK